MCSTPSSFAIPEAPPPKRSKRSGSPHPGHVPKVSSKRYTAKLRRSGVRHRADDISFKKPIRDQAEAIFAARKDTPGYIDYEFKDYKGMAGHIPSIQAPIDVFAGTCHGFAARPNLAIPEVVEGYKGALAQTVAWFQKTLQ